MARWITFDAATADQLRSALAGEAVFEAPGRNALEYALSSSGNVVAVLGAPLDNCSGLATFRRASLLSPAPARPRTIRATGFLGLSDEAVFEDDEQPKKNWWRRLWDD